MPVVRRLDESVASRIAAGEVIERPASALKELIENALDAGASRVDVEVEGGGRTLIRVRDDGCGMDAEDCRTAFERHATSKIKDLDDLDALSTFGFRGEALYAIAAVAKVKLTSCRKNAKTGTVVEVSGGKIVRSSEAAPVPGTVIEVRDLFFNTPARLKFLKSEASEKAQLSRVLEDAALANPGVAFSIKTGPRAKLEYVKGGRRERLADILGPELVEPLLHAKGEGLDAFVSPTDSLAATRQMQYLFVNRRPVACKALQQALYRAYEPFRARDRHPVAVLFLEAPPEELDVNVHPQKREVRFRREREVFERVASALSKALLSSKGVPTLEKARPAAFEPVSQVAEAVAAPMEFAYSAPAPGGAPRWYRTPIRYLGQIERTYLVFESGGGLLVMDQHAAQERIFFERYLKSLSAGKPAMQKLMLPVPVDLPPSAVERLLGRGERLEAAGFEVERFSKTSVRVTAVPEHFEKAGDVKDMVHHAVEQFLLAGAGQRRADARYDAAAMISCKRAVKAHDPLSEREALRLVEDLRECDDSTCCPHGRPTMLDLGREEIARRFGRSGAPPL